MRYALPFIASVAIAQALDPTAAGAYPAYPAYLDRSCGGVNLTITEMAGSSAMVRATTTCSTGGRGTKPRTYFACTSVEFDANGFPVGTPGERILAGSYTMGSTEIACPAL